MSRVEDVSEQWHWLVACAGEDEPCGFDLQEWARHTWVLHAMYELPGVGELGSHDEWNRRLVDLGQREPLNVDNVNLNDMTIATGIPLGFVARPGQEWRRLPWREYLDRFSQEERQEDYPPCYRWFPSGSWSAGVQPPPEGSLDDESLAALIHVLGSVSPEGVGSECYAHYGPYAAGRDAGPHLWKGPLRSIPSLTEASGGPYMGSPSNFWAVDRSWFVWTDWDLQGTKVSGSPQLVAALEGCSALETTAWPRSA